MEESKPRKRKIRRWVFGTLLALLLLITAAIGVLYIPGVLNGIAQSVFQKVEQSSGLQISADNILLRFPLDLSIDRATMVDCNGDTMVCADRASVSVNPLALLKGEIDISELLLANGHYRQGAPDSLFIDAHIDTLKAGATLDFKFSQIDVDHADLNGAQVLLLMGESTDTPEDTTAVSPLTITARQLTLGNVDYRMAMASTNDTVAAFISEAMLVDGRVFIADTIDISSRNLTVAVSSALYGARNADQLTLQNAECAIDSFAMHGAALQVPLTRLTADNILGISLAACGLFEMDSETIRASDFEIIVDKNSYLYADAVIGMDSIEAPITADVRAKIYPSVASSLLPDYQQITSTLPEGTPLQLKVAVDGTLAALRIDTIGASMDKIFNLQGSGSASNLTDASRRKIDATMRGSLVNSKPFASLLPEGVNLPALSLRATAHAQGNDYSANLTAVTAAGRLALDGTLNASAERYNVELQTDSLPIAAFMPDLGVGAITASVNARGLHFNPLHKNAKADADIQITAIEFRNRTLTDLNLTAKLADSRFEATINSSAEPIDLSLDINGTLTAQHTEWDLNGEIRRLDLQAVGLSDSIMNASMLIESQGFTTLNLDSLAATATVRNADLAFGSYNLNLDSLRAEAKADKRTELAIQNQTLNIGFNADESLFELIDKFSQTALAANDMVDKRNFEVDSLVGIMPQFNLTLNAEPGNPIAQVLATNGINFRNATLRANCGSTLRASAQIFKITSGESWQIDTLSTALMTHNDALLFNAAINNAPGTLDEFARVNIHGGFAGHDGKLSLHQQNIKGETGYKIGMSANLNDSLITVNLTPTDPTIAYKNWSVNTDNYITVNTNNMALRADLDAHGNDSRIQLSTDQSTDTTNNVALKITDFHIQDWLQINPFAPPIAGDVNANLSFNYTTKSVNGSGTIELDQLTYGKKSVGDFLLDLDVATDFGGAIRADAGLNVNNKKALTLSGALNDTTARSPLDLQLQLSEFPLDVANPFLSSNTATLNGALSGLININDNAGNLQLNGNLNFNDTKIGVAMIGSTFTLDTVSIPIENNRINFNNFAIKGSNDNPLTINGDVDLRRLTSPQINLNLAAQNMQVIKSSKARNIDLYGRGFINLDADVRGSLNMLRINADLAVLPQTNLTYQVSDSKAVAGLLPDDEIVKFVNFADTTQVYQVDSIINSGMKMFLNANVDIQEGAQFTVNLSADGQNRAQIKAHGTLDYTLSPTQTDGRLTGRLTIDGGEFRYSLPVISEKLFTFNPDSYVAFNGSILDPTLNISAVDQVRANVTRQGENSKLINFDVSLSATGTLSQMDVAFDLSTNDDISVQNELQAMSQTQRANQAMNLLLYGVYTGQGNAASTANLSSSALYGFLTSQLNTWAANTVKGVDISFGLDQYDSTRNGTTQTATQYSYKVSKSLFNDRFKIVVGGNYSSDANSDEEIAQNLISDISFEYMLNDSGTMYVRVFRHTGYESILEGEITQTGAGFVIKRRIRRLSEIFNFIKAAKQ